MSMRLFLTLASLISVLPAVAAVRSVGPGQPYAKPCQAFAAAQDGDTIEIDASGNYDGDVCPILKNNLVIRGVNGRARIDAAGNYAWGKGIWVVAGDGITIENIEFSGARVPDRNGAGIRLDSGNLTVRNCVFRNNENGILGGFYGKVLVEHSEFYDNGYGDGQSHNIYLNSGVAEFTLRYSASRRAKIGHLVKSRAAVNYILYNRLTQEDGTGSYELDLPNGGLAYVIGNIFQQGDSTQNRGMLAYGFEGQRTEVPNQLYVVNNTFVSTRAAGATFVQTASTVTTPAVIRNNIFSGSGILTTQTGALLAGNVTSGDMGFLNAGAYDYRISNLSAALNAGVEPGTASTGFSLRAAMQYWHPLCAVPRYDVGPIDAGAFEYGVLENNPVCASATEPPAPPQLQSFTLSSSTVIAGSSFTATVALSKAAPAGGAAVALESSSPEVVAVPASVYIPAGQTAAAVNLQAASVTSAATVVLTAALNGSSRSATVQVQPASAGPEKPRLRSISATPRQVKPGGKLQVTVRLESPAPAGGAAVSLSSSKSSVKLPASLVIPPGAQSLSVEAEASAGAQNETVHLHAYAANTVSTYIVIRAAR